MSAPTGSSTTGSFVAGPSVARPSGGGPSGGGPSVAGPSRAFADDLRRFVRARFPLLSITTAEEARVIADIAAVVGDRRQVLPPRQVFLWTTSSGFAELGRPAVPDTRTPHAALAAAGVLTAPSVVVMIDVHPWLGGGQVPPDTQLVRALKDTARLYQDGVAPRTLVLVSSVPNIPAELEALVTVVDYPLPDEPFLRGLLQRMIARNTQSGSVRSELTDEDGERLAAAAIGLTAFEAENAFARAMVVDGTLTAADVSVVADEKGQIIRKSGVLELVASTVKLDDIGGLGNLKTWLTKRNGSWLAEARSYGLPAPKGVLMTGVPGCGKSLTAKAMSSAWGLPLIRLDIGRVFGGLVGASEQNMRTAIRTAEAVAPCVLWIDEIEKGFASGASGTGDSGTSARVFGTFLSWMQEKKAAVFVMATANNISLLPPEFLRKGRFDEIFFVDLPTDSERRDIFGLHLRARLAAGPALGDLAVTDELLGALADETEGFSGAEIEQVAISACFDAFAGRRPLAPDDLHREIANTVPLSVTQSEEITALRRWADVRAVAASASQDRVGYAVPPVAVSVPPVDPLTVAERGGRPLEA